MLLLTEFCLSIIDRGFFWQVIHNNYSIYMYIHEQYIQHLQFNFIQGLHSFIKSKFKDFSRANFNFSRTEHYWGWLSHIWLNTHLPSIQTHIQAQEKWRGIIQRFENEAANNLKGGDLRQNCQIRCQYIHILYVFHLIHCPINKYEIYISRLI